MDSAGPVDIFVDLTELGRVRDELAKLINALVGLGTQHMVHADETATGSRDVAAAVNRFVDDWDTGRKRVVENLEACLRYVDAAVEDYGKTENALQCAMAPAATNGSGSP